MSDHRNALWAKVIEDAQPASSYENKYVLASLDKLKQNFKIGTFFQLETGVKVKLDSPPRSGWTESIGDIASPNTCRITIQVGDKSGMMYCKTPIEFNDTAPAMKALLKEGFQICIFHTVTGNGKEGDKYYVKPNTWNARFLPGNNISSSGLFEKADENSVLSIINTAKN